MTAFPLFIIGLALCMSCTPMVHGRERGFGICASDNQHKNAMPLDLLYCKTYSGNTCCTPDMAKDIHETIKSLVDEECTNCYKMMMEYKCSECSPDASLFYDGDCERAQVRLCEDYCEELFNTCKDIPLGIGSDDGTFYLNAGVETAAEFCKPHTMEDPYCFRGEFVPLKEDEQCKCPGHNCMDIPGKDEL